MWLADRFEKIDGKLMMIVLNRTGTERAAAPNTVNLVPPNLRDSDEISYLVAKTTFASWTKESTAAYAAGFDVTRRVSDRHAIYSFQSNSVRALVPASLLLSSLFRPLTVFWQGLQSPQGIEFICSPVVNQRHFTVRVPFSVLRTYLRDRSIIERLEWIYAYPSAYQAWNSVYEYACSGEIDVLLPKASILLLAKGKLIKNTVHLLAMWIFLVHPLEESLDWVRGKKNIYHCHNDIHQFSDVEKRICALRIEERHGEWQLTDHEWSTIKEIVERRAGTRCALPTHDRRTTIDCIVEKLGLERSWCDSSYDKHISKSACDFYRRTSRDGCWDEILFAFA